VTKTGKMIAIGVGAYLLYHWQQQQQLSIATAPTRPTNPSSPIPLWVQQIENNAGGGDILNFNQPMSSIDALLALPQGPGGTPQDFTGPLAPACILSGS
jgi:hypothetical protein